MVLHCSKCWLRFLRWLNYSSALGSANLSSGSRHLVERLRQRGLLHRPPPKSAEVLPPPVRWPRSFSRFVPNPMYHFWYLTNSYTVSGSRQLFFMKVTPQPALCLSERNKTAPYKSREKKLFFFFPRNFIFQTQAFCCMRLFINLGGCIFDLFTLCLQHILQSRFLLNGLWGTEEP